MFAYLMLFEFYPAYSLTKGDKEIRTSMDMGYVRMKHVDATIIFWHGLFVIEFIRQVTIL